MTVERADLEAILQSSQAAGFLGPGDLEVHVEHAIAFAAVIDAAAGPAPERILDLGSGGGVPGLVLAARCWPSAHWVLLDAAARRTEFLEWAVEELGLQSRVTVCRDRAESAGRDEELRGTMDVVLARSFASPPITVECAAPLLRVGGLLVVSEPPGAMIQSRWPAEPLAELGMSREGHQVGPPAMVWIRQQSLAAERWPRRVGIPGKRPLYQA